MDGDDVDGYDADWVYIEFDNYDDDDEFIMKIMVMTMMTNLSWRYINGYDDDDEFIMKIYKWLWRWWRIYNDYDNEDDNDDDNDGEDGNDDCIEDDDDGAYDNNDDTENVDDDNADDDDFPIRTDKTWLVVP